MATAYIETTIPSYYVARISRSLFQAAKQTATREWWDGGCSGFMLVTSMETVKEVGKGEDGMAMERLELLAGIPRLPMVDEALQMANELLTKGIVPAKAASDALHIAVASLHRIDYLVTWNFKHIANPFIQDRLRKAVRDTGFELPIMCSPEELLQSYDTE